MNMNMNMNTNMIIKAGKRLSRELTAFRAAGSIAALFLILTVITTISTLSTFRITAFAETTGRKSASASYGPQADGSALAQAIRSASLEPFAGGEELRGMWFSYLDWDKMPREEAAFREKADQVMASIRANGMNAIFCHVHSHSDSYYLESSYFPKSKFMVTKDSSPSFDPVRYMIDAAHRNGLQFHAWLNPYRVTGYLMKWDDVPEGSIVRIWESDPSRERNVLLHDGQYYLNPAREEVRNFLTGAIQEFLQHYDVEGIQFDDYFYPVVSSENDAKGFDYPEYLLSSQASGQASGQALSIQDFRRNNVSALVAAVHKTVHETRPGTVFGISPVPLLSELRGSRAYFVDIDRWMGSTEYIDYIMPQIYHGFEAKTGSGEVSPSAFIPCLQSWIDLKTSKNSPVRLCVGLALYKTGSSVWDGNEVPEWSRRNDILSREVQHARSTGQVSGFGFYDYANLEEAQCQPELANLRAVLQ